MDLNAGQLARRTDAVDQWCLRTILDIRWHDLSEMLTSIALPTSHHFHPSSLTFFGHLARMDENADACQAIFEPPPEN